MTEKKHVTVPKDTRAYFCSTCGAVSLDANNICKPESKGVFWNSHMFFFSHSCNLLI